MLITVRVGINGEQKSAVYSSAAAHTGVSVLWPTRVALGPPATPGAEEAIANGQDCFERIEIEDLRQRGRGKEDTEAALS